MGMFRGCPFDCAQVERCAGSDFDASHFTAAALAGLADGDTPDRRPAAASESHVSPFRRDGGGAPGSAAGLEVLGLAGDDDHAMVLASIAQSPPRPSRMSHGYSILGGQLPGSPAKQP